MRKVSRVVPFLPVRAHLTGQITTLSRERPEQESSGYTTKSLSPSVGIKVRRDFLRSSRPIPLSITSNLDQVAQNLPGFETLQGWRFHCLLEFCQHWTTLMVKMFFLTSHQRRYRSHRYKFEIAVSEHCASCTRSFKLELCTAAYLDRNLKLVVSSLVSNLH